MEELTKCLITDLPITDFKKYGNKSKHGPYIQYKVKIIDKIYEFGFCEDCLGQTKKFISENKDTLYSLLLNGKEIPIDININRLKYNNIDSEEIILDKENLSAYIKNNFIPSTPSEKLDNLFFELCSMSTFEGQIVDLKNPIYTDRKLHLKYFFKNNNELFFYIIVLENKGLIEITYQTFLDDLHNQRSEVPNSFKITYEGLIKAIELQEEGHKSNKCFVAMSFDKTEDYIFDEIIEPVCEKLKFKAIRVDRIHPNSDQTINDLIIAEIKKCKFIIADFTKNKDGVYFESGYGLGRGKKVIYSCHKDHFDKLHFDLNHFSFIRYESIEEFKEKLKNKIEAYILE